MKGKNAQQCRERYKHVIEPKIKQKREKDEKLMGKYFKAKIEEKKQMVPFTV